ncbi:response regulator transcription factor [Gammaproteobacteria bacterium]|nr:response regulator transcription factor [Gammaproteobacteria bacterium]
MTMTDSREARILLVEDHHDIAELVYDHLEDAGYTMDFAPDGKSALNLLADDEFDLLILDLMLPDIDGLEVCRRIREQMKQTLPILMLTARDTLEDKVEGLDRGADDYLVKPFAVVELEARIRALLRRGRSQSASEKLRVGDLELDTGTLEVRRAGQIIQLAPISQRILQVLMRYSPRVVTRRQIEQEIWGDELPDSDTLRSHLYNLRRAIDKPFDTPLLHTLQSAGYRLAELNADQ